MKICMLTSTYPRFPNDGSGRFIRSIAEAIARQGHEVHVVTPYHPSLKFEKDAVYIHHFRYIWPDKFAIMGYGQALYNDQTLRKGAYALAPLFFMGALFTTIKLHLRYRFDIFHAHWVVPNAPTGMVLSRITRIPLVISLHGSDVFLARKSRLLSALAKACFRHAAAITACSYQLCEGAIALGASKDQLRLVLWGADPDAFDPTRFPSQLALRKQLGWPDECYVILSLGRLVKKKGVDYLIRSIPILKKKIKNILVIIAGDGPERKSLEDLTESMGVRDLVRFVGAIPWTQVAHLLHASDVFVVPSIEDDTGNLDGLPTAILEAMAAGKPIVATSVGGIPLVVSDGRTGLLVPQKDPEALAQALVRILSDNALSKNLGIFARKMVIEYLNWDRVASDFIQIYMKLNQEQGKEDM